MLSLLALWLHPNYTQKICIFVYGQVADYASSLSISMVSVVYAAEAYHIKLWTDNWDNVIIESL